MTRESIIKRLKENTDWYHKGFSGYLYGIHDQALGISEASKKKTKFALPWGVLFVNCTRKEYFDWFWDNELLISGRQKIINEVATNKKVIDEIFSDYLSRYKKYISYHNSIKENINLLSKEEISKRLKDLHELLVAQAEIGYIADNFLTADKKDWLIEKIREEMGDKLIDGIVKDLTAPAFVSFVNSFEFEVEKLARLLKEKASNDQIEKAAQEIVKNFYWVRTNYRDCARVDEKVVINEAQKIAEFNTLNEKSPFDLSKNHIAAKRKIFNKYKLSQALQNIIQLSETMAEIQDKRKECVLRHNTICFEMLDRLAEILGIEKGLLFNATYHEIAEFILSPKSDLLETLKTRRDGLFMVIYHDGKFDLVDGEIARRDFPISKFFNISDAGQEIKGTTAFRGRRQGKVRILFSQADIEKFRDGEILVTNQTTPEFVPAMKKAAAVVTDQGGITCHAAIISRELKIPCIVGTKVATKVLKDGDTVEVDAEKGTVKILK